MDQLAQRVEGDDASTIAPDRRGVEEVVSASLHADAQRIPGSTAFAAKLRLLLTSGGDERIALHPHTGRNRYGTTPGPNPGEIYFASSTASTITPRGHAAASRTLARIVSRDRADRLGLEDWFDDLRGRLLDLFGIPGADVVLAASGTETELIALAFARGTMARPILNIVVAPGETGSGVRLAAAGQHFLSTSTLQGDVTPAARLAGWEDAEIGLETVEIRAMDGRLRSPDDVDRDAAALAMRALGAGQDVLLHVLDASKTGVSGVSRAAAARIMAAAPTRVTVVVDACQMRCAPKAIQADLDAGFLVMVTGSKFAGGPPFAGALLVPAQRLARFAAGARLPAGLAAYSAALDWPARVRDRLEPMFTAPANLGLGLRWEAALAEIEALARVPSCLQAAIFTRYARLVGDEVAARGWLQLLDSSATRLPDGRPRTILPIVMPEDRTGEMTQAVFEGLRKPLRHIGRRKAREIAAICHVGQPVRTGPRVALRLCASAPMAVAVAERIAAGCTLEAAMAPVHADLAVVFRKWAALRRLAQQGAASAAAAR